jgi:large subunit ribosomal protein L30
MPKKTSSKTKEIKPKVVQITMVKSPIGYKENQRGTLRALGLRRMNQTVQQVDSPTLRGMIASVSHLIEVIEVVDA